MLEQRPDPVPGPGEVRVRVEACGVCRTDLHVVDGELPDIDLPIVPGHEIVVSLRSSGPGVTSSAPDAASVSPGSVIPAASAPSASPEHENLCDRPVFTG